MNDPTNPLYHSLQLTELSRSIEPTVTASHEYISYPLAIALTMALSVIFYYHIKNL